MSSVIGSIADYVRVTLDECPESRDDDKVLYRELCSRFYKRHIAFIKDRLFVDPMEVPEQKYVSRIRRELQSNGICRASEKVRRKREKHRAKVAKELKRIIK